MKIKDKITKAIILGVESLIAFIDYEKKAETFNKFLRRNKLK